MMEPVVSRERIITCPVTGKQLVINLAAHRVTIRNVEVKLTKLEFKLLWLFVNNVGIALTHQQLITRVWGKEDGASINSLQAHIKKLLDKVRLDDASWDITSLRGVGYRFDVG